MRRRKTDIKALGVGLILIVILVACAAVPSQSPHTDSTIPSGQVTETPLPKSTVQPGPLNDTQTPISDNPAIVSAVSALSQKLDVPPAAIEVFQIVEKEWPDACLGIHVQGQACADVITPGYWIQLSANEKIYEVHTNLSGSLVRLQNLIKSGEVTIPVSNNIPEAVTVAQKDLAQRLALDVSGIDMIGYEVVNWPDACLGVSRPGIACAQVITSGYRIILSIQGQKYEYHTNANGSQVLQARVGVDDTSAKPIMVFEESTNTGCFHLEISALGVRGGGCNGEMLNVSIKNNDRLSQLDWFVQTFQPFTWKNQNGSLTFNGRGLRPAAVAEQRSVAEWLKLVGNEANLGQDLSGNGVMITWSRTGGIAGNCDEMTVLSSGWAVISSCKTHTDARVVRLTDDELTQLYTWIDLNAPFVREKKDDAVSDAMKMRLEFSGVGGVAPSLQTQQSIELFTQTMFDQSILQGN